MKRLSYRRIKSRTVGDPNCQPPLVNMSLLSSMLSVSAQRYYLSNYAMALLSRALSLRYWH